MLDEILEFVWIYGDGEGWVEVKSEIEGCSGEVADGEERGWWWRSEGREGGSKVDGEEGVDEEGEVGEVFGCRVKEDVEGDRELDSNRREREEMKGKNKPPLMNSFVLFAQSRMMPRD